MRYEIVLARHRSQYNSFLKSILEQNQMLVAMDESYSTNMISDFSSEDINARISSKKTFAFALKYNDREIGFLCLDDIDWEDRHCRIKGGLFARYLDEIEIDSYLLPLYKVLEFCKGNLRMNRVWGTITNNNAKPTSIIAKVFTLEGATLNNDVLYYGYLLNNTD